MSRERVRVRVLMYMTKWERLNNRPRRLIHDPKVRTERAQVLLQKLVAEALLARILTTLIAATWRNLMLQSTFSASFALRMLIVRLLSAVRFGWPIK